MKKISEQRERALRASKYLAKVNPENYRIGYRDGYFVLYERCGSFWWRFLEL